jgi:hypothetical protein
MAYAEMPTRAAGYTVLHTDWNTMVENFNTMCIGHPPGGRLTVTSGTPVANATASANLYYTPYLTNTITLYDGANWVYHNFTERTLSLSGYAANTNFDIFIYNNAGTLTLTSVAWTDATTRATDIVRQDGIYCLTGQLTLRYLGTIRTTGVIGQTSDADATRYVWNYYNRRPRRLFISEAANSWTYATATWRYFNNTSANTLQFVIGVNEDVVDATFMAMANGNGGAISLALDAPNIGGQSAYSTNTNETPLVARYSNMPGQGYHFLACSEISALTNTITFYGDNNSPGAIQSAAAGVIAA